MFSYWMHRRGGGWDIVCSYFRFFTDKDSKESKESPATQDKKEKKDDKKEPKSPEKKEDKKEAKSPEKKGVKGAKESVEGVKGSKESLDGAGKKNKKKWRILQRLGFRYKSLKSFSNGGINPFFSF